MNARNQFYLLVFIALMTVMNTILILTKKPERILHRYNAAAEMAPPPPRPIDRPMPVDPPSVPTGPTTTMIFDNGEHDFGKVKQHSKNPHTFTFTNTGSHPLLIADASASCGCTVPSYPKEPIMPGERGKIEVVYSPGDQSGSQVKTVTVKANTEPPTMQLTVKAEVVKE